MKSINLVLNQGQLKQITKQVRDEGGADNRFDVNLLEGKLSENAWSKMFETIEFKKDYKAGQTGNVAIEYFNNGKKSGIAVTEAKYVAYILVDKEQNENAAIFLKTSILKDICRKYLGDPKRDVKGGDNKSAHLILLPVEELLNPKHLFGVQKKEPEVVYSNVPQPKKSDWTYGCSSCSHEYPSNTKSLYMTCPDCRKKGNVIKMEII